jgi:hypothetical protein
MVERKRDWFRITVYVFLGALTLRAFSLGSQVEDLRAQVANAEDVARRAFNKAQAAEYAAAEAGRR